MFRERAPRTCEQEPTPLEEVSFERSGGRILDYDEDGRPTNWICGHTERGDLIHPAEAPGKPVPYLAACGEDGKQSQWHGAVPGHPAVADMHEWQ